MVELVDRIVPFLDGHVLKAGVVLVDDAEPLGQLRVHPVAWPYLAGRLADFVRVHEVVAHAVRTVHEALGSQHVVITAFEHHVDAWKDDVHEVERSLAVVPLIAPHELAFFEGFQALVRLVMAYGVLVFHNHHLDVGKRRVRGRPDQPAIGLLGYLARIVTRSGDDGLGDLLDVVADGRLVLRLGLLPIHLRERHARRRHQAAARLAAARNGEVPRHGLKEHGRACTVLSKMALRGRVVELKMHGLARGIKLGKSINGFGRKGTNALGPFGRLLHAVDLAHDVGAPLRKALWLHPSLDVFVVVQVFRIKHVRNGQKHGNVGARTYWQPLVCKGLCAVGVARVDHDDLCTLLLCELHVIGHASKPADQRIDSP